jgi:hypothetical protein
LGDTKRLVVLPLLGLYASNPVNLLLDITDDDVLPLRYYETSVWKAVLATFSNTWMGAREKSSTGLSTVDR